MAEAAAAGTPLTVALIDLDYFKRINDTLSHDVGDRVLVMVADLLSARLDSLAGDGFVARMGGEEFLVVLPEVGILEAPERLDEIRLDVAAHCWAPVTGALPVTVSIGAVSLTAAGGETQAELLAEADRRLYVAKHAGRNRVVARP
jgi:diguanylate cyclase (GGDEF)-like protein